MTGNQIAKADAGKLDPTLVPRELIWAVADIRDYGTKKYPNGGRDNWKQVEIERYRAAGMRHYLAYLDDPHGVDEESGRPHLWHLACNVAFMCAMETFDFPVTAQKAEPIPEDHEVTVDTETSMTEEQTEKADSTMGKKKPIDKEKIFQLKEEGMRNSDIARAVGCSPSYVTNALKDSEQTVKDTLVDYGKIKALYDAGKSITWIADDMGLRPQMVGDALKQMREKGKIV